MARAGVWTLRGGSLLKRKWRRVLSLALSAAMLWLPAASLAGALGGLTIPPGMMIHARQVLERYDASGEPLLSYFELWADGSRALQWEVREDGALLACAFSGPRGHIIWQPDTMEASRPEASAVFLPDYPALKAGFGRETAVPGQSYAGRACTAVLLDGSDLDADWLRVFLDDETGFVLLCEAPLFRLRTALLETLPVDDARLMPPDGLLY